MTYQIPRRNVTFADQLMTNRAGEQVTIRRCTLDGEFSGVKVFINGWLARTYKTNAGLQHFMKVHGVTEPTPEQLKAWSK